MPDRAIIALLPAAALGFIAGIIAATLQLEDTPTLIVGLVGGIAVILAGVTSVFGVRAEGGEKSLVAALRAACAVGVFACIYLFILGFLRDGNVLAIIWIPLALALGVVSTRIVIRDREQEEGAAASS